MFFIHVSSLFYNVRNGFSAAVKRLRLYAQEVSLTPGEEGKFSSLQWSVHPR